MKKIFKISFLLLMVLCFSTVVGCKKKHEHDYHKTTINPTCLTAGYTTYKCECGDVYDGDRVEALGHDEVQHSYKAATCLEDGNEAYVTCSRCEYTTFAKITATGHSYSEQVVSPTCEEKGYTIYTCSCGDSYTGNETEKTAHVLQTIPGYAPTCKATGLTDGSYCINCETILEEQEVIEKLPHNVVVDEAVNATCETTGLTEGSHCSECNEVLVAQEVVSASHNFVDYTCTKCNGTYLTFTLNADGVTYSVSKGTASVTEVVIPATYNGKAVTTIPSDAFFNWDSLEKITIAESVINIGDSIFSQCDSLTQIIVNAGNPVFDSRENCNGIVRTATNSLFMGCKNTTVPTSVVSISDKAFMYTMIESIHIPSNIEWIGYKAFYYCTELKNVTIDEGVKTIYYSAFEECHTLTSISLPNSLTTVGASAFRFCKALTEIVIPDSVTELGFGALSFCDNLQKAKLSSGLSVIAQEMFFQCYSLTEVSIPNGVLTIKQGAFQWCTKLVAIELPNSVVEVCDYAFADCRKLTTVSFGNNIDKIGLGAFSGCKVLETVYYSLSQDRWAQVQISGDNNYLKAANFVYNN